jgi:class II lanthipeptide synthase
VTVPTIAAAEFLETAVEIGSGISRQAVWHDDRCNWLGAEPLERRDAGFQPAATYAAFGPDLYSGSSGVALFLAELFRVTSEPEARRASLGGIRHALSRTNATQPAARLGLFSGWTGIALAAVRVASIVGDPDLLDDARALLHRASLERCEKREFDLISGRAGAIAALVVLNHVLHDARLLDFAIRLADELLETARRVDIGYSWESPGWANQHDLTGFSHGAAGAGYSLLELFQATGISKYRDAAQQAFQYERHWFNAGVGNWPDFRKDLSSPYRRKKPHSYLSFWCHGAPGIALSRLRAYEIMGDETCKAEAGIALRTTRASIESALDTSAGNFSLCHGLSGNMEALIYGAAVLDADDLKDTASLASDVAAAGVERYAARGEPWPCGTHAGETPNLMLGLSGIGHFYLRLCHPSIPSLLILRKEEWDPIR